MTLEDIAGLELEEIRVEMENAQHHEDQQLLEVMGL
jgi:hypothetical protein